MCDRCLDIDYRVADCWRPCYVPPKRARPSLPPIRIPNEQDFEADRIIATLRDALKAKERVLRRQAVELEAWRAGKPEPAPAAKRAFEGV